MIRSRTLALALFLACTPATQMEVSSGLAGTKPVPVVISYWQYMPDTLVIRKG